MKTSCYFSPETQVSVVTS